MRVAVCCVLLCFGSAAIAQVRSISDPSAFHSYSAPPKAGSASAAPAPPAQPTATGARGEMLNDDSIIGLVKAGLGPETVVAKINASKGAYDTSTNALIQMKQAGVPDPVIAAMLNRSKSSVLIGGVTDNTNPDPMVPHSPGIYMLDPRGAE